MLSSKNLQSPWVTRSSSSLIQNAAKLVRGRSVWRWWRGLPGLGNGAAHPCQSAYMFVPFLAMAEVVHFLLCGTFFLKRKYRNYSLLNGEKFRKWTSPASSYCVLRLTSNHPPYHRDPFKLHICLVLLISPSGGGPPSSPRCFHCPLQCDHQPGSKEEGREGLL